MGGAAGIIGVAMQGVSAFGGGGGGGGTVYRPDPRAKYEADLFAFDRAKENMKLGEEILSGQIDAQKGFAKYNYDMQNIIMDREINNAQNQLEAQYNMSLFNSSINRLTNETERLAQLSSFQLQEAQREFEYGQQTGELGRQRQGLDIQRAGLRQDLAGQQQGFQRASDVTRLRKDKLAQDKAMDEQALSYATKELDLADAGLVDARTKLEYQKMGLNLQQAASDSQFAQAMQGYDRKSGELTVQEQLNKANADMMRTEALRNLANQLEGENRAFAQLLTQRKGAQAGAIGRDIMNTGERDRGVASLMDRYAQQYGQAELQTSMGEQEIDAQRQGTTESKRFSDMGIGLERQGVQMAGNEIGRQQMGLDNARQQALSAYTNAQAQREIEANDIQSQEAYDFYTKSLMPSANYNLAMQQTDLQQQGLEDQQAGVDFNRQQQARSLGLGRQAFGTQQGIAEAQMDLQEKADYSDFGGALQQVQDQYAMNQQSNYANYMAQLGAAQQQHGAGMNQLAASQHGILSQLGGYQSPPPAGGGGGGGFNPAGIGKFAQGLMSYLGQQGVGGGGQGGVQWGSYGSPVQTGFTPAASYPSGNYSGNSMSFGGFNG